MEDTEKKVNPRDDVHWRFEHLAVPKLMRYFNEWKAAKDAEAEKQAQAAAAI